jgi:hypothetical protein
MVDAGYFAKRVAAEPEWLNVSAVHEICSASHCISSAPDAWIEHWLHNEFGWFNRASDALAVVRPDQKVEFRCLPIGSTLKSFEAASGTGW